MGVDCMIELSTKENRPAMDKSLPAYQQSGLKVKCILAYKKVGRRKFKTLFEQP